MKGYSIVIPLHNEQDNIRPLMASLHAAVWGKIKPLEVLMVNDHSTDNTSTILSSLQKTYPYLRIIHRKHTPRGMGAALKEGTQKAKYNVVVWVMGDCSDNPKTILQMAKAITSGSDIVIGGRYGKGGSPGDLPPIKAFCSMGFSRIAALLFGIKVKDITNAFRMFRKEVFLKIMPSIDNFAISPEFIIKAHKSGCAISEVPTTYYNRKAGKNKFGMFSMGWEYTKVLVRNLR